MNLKIFIVCSDRITGLNIAKRIIMKDDSYSIAPTFTTNKEYDNEINEEYITYMDVNTVNLSYKNNSLLYIKTNNYISSGITIDDFYNNDICIMNIYEYNLIPEVIFSKYDILTIWIDSKNHGNLSESDLIEINYFNKFLEKITYLYFLNNESNIDDTILKYLNGTDEEKNEIFLNNS
jgi:hypothetical protein